MKKFFGITESFRFEWNDVVAFITLLNVILVLLGFSWAPIFGIANGVLSLALNVKYRAHINLYVMQLAIIVLNIYFLSLAF